MVAAGALEPKSARLLRYAKMQSECRLVIADESRDELWRFRPRDGEDCIDDVVAEEAHARGSGKLRDEFCRGVVGNARKWAEARQEDGRPA